MNLLDRAWQEACSAHPRYSVINIPRWCIKLAFVLAIAAASWLAGYQYRGLSDQRIALQMLMAPPSAATAPLWRPSTNPPLFTVPPEPK